MLQFINKIIIALPIEKGEIFFGETQFISRFLDTFQRLLEVRRKN